MNTVGYGDITPQNPLEIIFSIIFMFVACGLFGYVLNSIGNILHEISKRNNEFLKEKNMINQFMKEKKINYDLQMRVRKYLEFIWNEENVEVVEKQKEIILKLSDPLKEELLLEANGSIIKETKLLSLNFSEETLRKTMNIMNEVRFTPGDLIYQQNEGKDKSLFIIRKVKLKKEKLLIMIKIKKKKNYINYLKSLDN